MSEPWHDREWDDPYPADDQPHTYWEHREVDRHREYLEDFPGRYPRQEEPTDA